MKHVIEDNKWTLNDYSTDAIECIALSNIAGYTSATSLVFKAYANTRSLYRRPMKTYEKKHTLANHSNASTKISIKSNSFIDLYRREV